MSLVEFRDVYKRYQMGEITINAVDGISFSVEEGEFAVVVGASGAGKTTVLNILGGMDSCTEGEIIVGGRNVSRLSDRQLIEYRRYDIGFVFQFYNLVHNLTAKENVELAAQICRDPMDSEKALESVGLLEREVHDPVEALLADGVAEHVGGEVLGEVLEPRPPAAQDARRGTEVLEGDHDAVHRHIAEYEDVHDGGQQHHPQLPIVGQLPQKAPLRPRGRKCRPVLGHTHHAPLVGSVVFPGVPPGRPCRPRLFRRRHRRPKASGGMRKSASRPVVSDDAWDYINVPSNWPIEGLDTLGKQRYGTPIYVNQPVIFMHTVREDDWRGGVMREPPKTWTTYRCRNEVGSYRKTFTIPSTWDGRETFINFDGVDSFFYLWINGRYVGFSKNSRNRIKWQDSYFDCYGCNFA